MSEVSTPKPGDQSEGPVISEIRAKQGRGGRHTFTVLLVSTALAVMMVFGLWAFSSGGLASADHAARASRGPAAAHFNAGPSQPRAGTTQSADPT